VIIYAILILAWFVSWLTVGDANWRLILLNRIVPYLFIPVPLFLVWGIYTRRSKSVIALFVPCLIFVWIYHPYLFPKIFPSSQSNSQLNVMTYNVLFSNLDYDGVANVILTYQPDLVALQEVKIEMMDALEDRLARDYSYSLMGMKNDFGTTAVFSKYPFTDAYTLDLQADRPATVVKVNVNGQNVTFVAVHLLAYNLWWTKLKDIPAVVLQRTTDQNRQVEILLDELEEEDGIVIVGCDCNSYETSSSYLILRQSMHSAAQDMGWLLGKAELVNTRQDIDLQHIDFIWYREPLIPIGVYKILDSGGSDHLPVLANFNIQ
jgi:endonuclease/exonuclease/phosphatase (EEP) superfamily protein YafD